MGLETPPPLAVATPPRSIFVTLLGWTLLVVGALVSPVSAISLLMLIAGSYGTASADVSGVLSVVVAPPFAVLTGVGLLRRWRWSWAATLILLVGLIAFQVRELATGRRETTTTTTASGVKTTVIGSGPNYHSGPIIILALIVMAKVGSRSVRAELGVRRRGRGFEAKATSPIDPARTSLGEKRDWRVGHLGRDRMYYEEGNPGAGRRLELDGEMLTGRAHHVIYFDSAARWQSYPEWARFRRDEIIGRIKSELRPPDYEYRELPTAGATGAKAPVRTEMASTRAKPAVPSRQLAASWLVVVLLVGLAVFMGWLVQRGIVTGVTTLPINRVSLQRPLARATEPVAYWAALGIYSVLGVGAAGGAAWLARETRRARLG